MDSFDNKDERVARFCDRADENSEIPETASGAGASGCKRAHDGSRVAGQACRDLLQVLYRPRCIAGELRPLQALSTSPPFAPTQPVGP